MRPVYWKRRDPGGFYCHPGYPEVVIHGKTINVWIDDDAFLCFPFGRRDIDVLFDGWCMETPLIVSSTNTAVLLLNKWWWLFKTSMAFPTMHLLCKLFMFLHSSASLNVTAVDDSLLLSGTCWQSSHNIRLSTPRHAYLSLELREENKQWFYWFPMKGCRM